MEGPRLVVRGRWAGLPPEPGLRNAALFYAAIVLGTSGLLVAAFTWFRLSPLWATASTGVTLLTPFVIACLYIRPRSGVARFFDDRIVLERHNADEETREMRSDEVESFDDAQSDTLLPKVSHAPLSIPTPNDNARTRVLALLDEKGLRRRG